MKTSRYKDRVFLFFLSFWFEGRRWGLKREITQNKNTPIQKRMRLHRHTDIAGKASFYQNEKEGIKSLGAVKGGAGGRIGVGVRKKGD